MILTRYGIHFYCLHFFLATSYCFYYYSLSISTNMYIILLHHPFIDSSHIIFSFFGYYSHKSSQLFFVLFHLMKKEYPSYPKSHSNLISTFISYNLSTQQSTILRIQSFTSLQPTTLSSLLSPILFTHSNTNSLQTIYISQLHSNQPYFVTMLDLTSTVKLNSGYAMPVIGLGYF